MEDDYRPDDDDEEDDRISASAVKQLHFGGGFVRKSDAGEDGQDEGRKK